MLDISLHFPPSLGVELHTRSVRMAQPGKSTAGVLQISASATKPGAPTKKAPKPPTPRLKLLIRRLPPGLTQSELEGALGQDWKVGGGKVDWLQYKPGKVSKEYGSREAIDTN